MKQLRAFLSHNSADKPAVEEIGRRLINEGIECWLDKWNLIPGSPWQHAIEEALDNCSTCVVFIGPSGLGPWQNEEMRIAIDARVCESNGRFRVIPVLLPGAHRDQRSRLPSFLVASSWVEFRSSLDETEQFHRLVCGIRGVEPGAGSPKAVYEGQCPYRGLKVFQPEHASFFFGREARVEWLLNKFRSDFGTTKETRFLGIVGASGSGKSSLTRAGLIPAIKNGQLEGSSDWPIIICRPGNNPLEELAKSLFLDPSFRDAIVDVGDAMDRMSSEQRRLHLITSTALHSDHETRRALVVVDQFEEVFTLCRDEESRRAFIDNLLYASSVPLGRSIVVLTMRADFYGRCSTYPALATALSDHQELVPPMTEDELRRAIERPAQLAGCELEPGLSLALLQDMARQPGALPLLQHALRELWDRRDGRKMTVESYENIGRLEGALQRYADEFFLALNETEQVTCRQIFMRLTRPGDGNEDTKRRAQLQELGEDDGIVGVVEKLANARLITTERVIRTKPDDAVVPGSSVEVSHEALIRSWTRLREWVDSNRESIRTQQRLNAAASEWDRASRDDAFLLRGARLAEAEEWSSLQDSHLSRLEQEFLRESIDRRDREAVARLRKMTVGLLGAAIVAVVMTGLAVYAFKIREEAQTLLVLFRGFTDETLRHDGNPEIALRELDNFVKNHSWNPEYKVLLVDSYNIRGEILNKTGNPSDAEPFFRTAQMYLESLPDGNRYRHERVRTLNNLGTLLMASGREDEARQYFEDAIAKGQQDSESNQLCRQDLARSHNNLAILLREQDNKAAEDNYKLAIKTHPREAKFVFEMVRWQNNYAAFLNEQKRYEMSQAVIAEALKLGEKRSPKDAQLRFEHARSLQISGETMNALNEAEGARTNYQLAENICTELARVETLAAQHRFQSIFGQVLYERAMLLVDDSKVEDGIELLRRAAIRHQVAHELAPDNSTYKENLYWDYWALADASAKLKNHEKAATAAAELPTLKPDGAGHDDKAYFLAKCWDIANHQVRDEIPRKYFDQAIESLKAAKRLKREINRGDFKPLHGQTRFEELFPK